MIRVLILSVKLRIRSCIRSCLRSNSEDEIIIPLTRLTTYEKCLQAVSRDGNNLRYVPIYFLSYNLCYIAVRQCGSAIEYVPYHMITNELCLLQKEYRIIESN